MPKKLLKTNAELQIVDSFSQWHELAILKLLSVCPRLEQMSKYVNCSGGQVSYYQREELQTWKVGRLEYSLVSVTVLIFFTIGFVFCRTSYK